MAQLPVLMAEELREAFRLIAARDPDRAHERNSMGFSAADDQFGHALASLPIESWTPVIARDAWECLGHYWSQLEEAGVAYDDLPVPPDYGNKYVTIDSPMGRRKTTKGRAQVLGFGRAAKSGHIPMIRIEGKDVLIDSARDKVLIEAVKALPGRKWLGNPPLWLVPVQSKKIVAALIELAKRYEMVVPDDFANTLNSLTGEDTHRDKPIGIRLDESGESMRVSTGFTSGAFEVMSKLTGSAYDKESDSWRIPLTKASWVSILAIAERFELPIDSKLQHMAEQLFADAIKSYHEAIALKPTGRVTEIPGMADVPGKPFAPAQWAGVEYIVDNDSGCLVADEPGVAKTAETYAALAYLGRKKIVWVCPAIAKEKMQREANERFPQWRTAIIDGRAVHKGREALVTLEGNETALLILNYEILTAHLDTILAWEPDAVVFDEAHRLKEAQTSWTKAARGTPARKGEPDKVGLAEQVRSSGGSVILLTGTPMPSGPWELISLLQIMGKLDELGGWMHFARHFCGAHREIKQGRSIWVMDKRQNLGELNMLLRQHGMLRRRLKDVCPELECLPPEFVDVELDPTYLAEYREAERDIASYMAQRAAELARSLGANPYSAAVRARLKAKMAEDAIELAVLRRLIGMAKLPGAIAWAKEFFELNADPSMAEFDGEEPQGPAKLAVAAYHRDVVAALYEALGGVAITGGDSRTVRDKARYAFQEDPEVRIITCSILAAGEAIELTAAHTTLVVEYDWVPKTHIQWVGRLYRRGQVSPVRPVYAHALGTTDDIQRGVLDSKDEAAGRAIDGTASDAQGEFENIETRMMNALIAIGASEP